MSVYDGKARLAFATQKLQRCWEDVSPMWSDSAGRFFQREHLEPWEPKIATALRAIERLAEVLSQAQRECNDR